MMLNDGKIALIILNALREDIGSGDITTKAIISGSKKAHATIRAKQDGIVYGHCAARAVYSHLDKKSRYKILVKDGAPVKKGTLIAEVHASMKTILSGERVALNFLMHLSGIASYTAIFVAAVRGLKVRILDTRKTTPGLRLLEKEAVRMGGGENHRIGLYDMYLIKDNHIEAAGSIGAAIKACLKKRGRKKIKIEVETCNLEQIAEALRYKIDRIMLDNMTPARMTSAVKFIRSFNPEIEIEASGNVDLKSVRKIAQSGVDIISIGKLTHSAPSLDLSMEIIPHEK